MAAQADAQQSVQADEAQRPRVVATGSGVLEVSWAVCTSHLSVARQQQPWTQAGAALCSPCHHTAHLCRGVLTPCPDTAHVLSTLNKVYAPGLSRSVQFVHMGSPLLWARSTGLKVRIQDLPPYAVHGVCLWTV